MNTVIYEECIKIARKGTITYYSDIAGLVGLNMDLPPDRNRIGELLDEINRYEFANNRPLISAVVVQKDSMRPGQGFFKLARSLGLFTGNNKESYYIQELKKVHSYWSTH